MPANVIVGQAAAEAVPQLIAKTLIRSSCMRLSSCVSPGNISCLALWNGGKDYVVKILKTASKYYYGMFHPPAVSLQTYPSDQCQDLSVPVL